ncbi:MAG TPA: choice-of-anchor M domain-containing protein [Kribbella sp.]|uniref:choice-of-anchor M domain-containing protein n=1 Tax=Kribbella sp. TaxID=1871183 RepID=UPI002D769423|nr:choice-of-anchor M domain-containing protein [Kribbella sp.]HET6298617.1 choice-of-anchor M domain-containing protein [Kribbella sp.]
MRKPYRVVLPTVAVLALAGFTVPADAAPRVVLDQGHVDVIGIAFEDGAFNVHVHDEAHGVEYAPSEVQLVAKPASEIAVPDDPAYRFLGAAGARAWVLPQVQDPELLWPGIGSEEIGPGVFTDEALKVDIVGVTGPAALSIFTTDSFGAPTVLADSGNGLPDRINTTAGGHLHANWAFEAAGTYQVKVRVSGTLAATGKKVTSTTAVYCFKVAQ